MPQGAARMEMLLLVASHLVSKRIHALWGSNASLVSSECVTCRSYDGWLVVCVHRTVVMLSGFTVADSTRHSLICECAGLTPCRCPLLLLLAMQMAEPAWSRRRSSPGSWTTA